MKGQGDGCQDPREDQGAASPPHGCQDQSAAGHTRGQEGQGLQVQQVRPVEERVDLRQCKRRQAAVCSSSLRPLETYDPFAWL